VKVSWGLFGGPLGPLWGPLGSSWEVHGGLLAVSGVLLGRRAVSSTSLSWAPLGALLERSWAVLWPSCAVLGPSWGPLGPSWGDLGSRWVRLGGCEDQKSEYDKLSRFLLGMWRVLPLGALRGVLLELSRGVFGASWGVLRPSWILTRPGLPCRALWGSLGCKLPRDSQTCPKKTQETQFTRRGGGADPHPHPPGTPPPSAGKGSKGRGFPSTRLRRCSISLWLARLKRRAQGKGGSEDGDNNDDSNGKASHTRRQCRRITGKLET